MVIVPERISAGRQPTGKATLIYTFFRKLKENFTRPGRLPFWLKNIIRFQCVNLAGPACRWGGRVDKSDRWRYVRTNETYRGVDSTYVRTSHYLVAGGLTALLMVAGEALGGHSGMVIALVVAAVMNIGSYWYSDKVVLTMYRARRVGPREAPKLYGVVEALAKRGEGDRDGGNVFGALLMMIVAPIAAALIQFAVSRSREYGADKGGAELSGNALWLARALRKLEQANRSTPMHAASAHPGTAHMFIINPLSGQKLAQLFSTHPPTEERIRRLEAMARATPVRAY